MTWSQISHNVSCQNSAVHIWSNQFTTQSETNLIIINNKEYYGHKPIDEIVEYPLSVSFSLNHKLTDAGVLLEWRCVPLIPCCVVIKLSGATNSNLNQLYFTNGSLVDNRPAYTSSNEMYGIWFDDYRWVVGSLSRQNESSVVELGSVHIQTNHSKYCPVKSKWKDNIFLSSPDINITIECDSKCICIKERHVYIYESYNMTKKHSGLCRKCR